MKNQKIKPLKCYAIVLRKNPKLNAFQIYEDKDVVLEKDEELVRIEIKVVK